MNNELRIIGGQWRGRRLKFPPLPGIRPTLDRVRETVFNWLQFEIAGSRCLDLFAGSGALGLEALSRGAARVTFVDTERAVGEHLRKTLELLRASDRAVMKVQNALKFLSGPLPDPLPFHGGGQGGGDTRRGFDIVFLDPPFASQALPELCRLLEERGWLAPRAAIYLEMPAKAGEPQLPPGWTLLKSKQAGEVGYHLARREAPP